MKAITKNAKPAAASRKIARVANRKTIKPAKTESAKPAAKPAETYAARKIRGYAYFRDTFAGFGIESIPFKPETGFKAQPIVFRAAKESASVRQLAAAACLAAMHDLPLAAGTRLPRAACGYILENGASRDCVDSGVFTLAPESAPGKEIFILTARGASPGQNIRAAYEAARGKRDMLAPKS